MPNKEILDAGIDQAKELKQIEFPINFEFKIGTLANDFTVTDGKGRSLGYVRQKMFKLKEAIQVFSDTTKQTVNYKINADRIIDFNACYSFVNQDEEEFGKVARKGAKSLWKANYEIFDKGGVSEYTVNEENPWAKVMDALMGEVPVVSLFTGYMFNPKYAIKDKEGKIVARFVKEASFFGRKFKLEKVGDVEPDDYERMLLAVMMILLLERRRG